MNPNLNAPIPTMWQAPSVYYVCSTIGEMRVHVHISGSHQFVGVAMHDNNGNNDHMCTTACFNVYFFSRKNGKKD